MKGVRFGRAGNVGKKKRGWIVGNFLKDALRKTELVEVKWSIHKEGENKPEFVQDRQRAITILIRGKIREYFRRGKKVFQRLLNKEGDFIVSDPLGEKLEHRWKVEEDDTLVVTVKWPSIQFAQ